MSAPLKIPMPLRVPELAPSLGRVIVPRRLAKPWIPLDDIRERLATRIFELGGEARAAALREQREAAIEAVSPRARAAAWEPAVTGGGRGAPAGSKAPPQRPPPPRTVA